jgi:transposase
VRLREDHLRARTTASRKLGALLEAHWPGPKAVFYRLASPIALAFLAEYPTPQAAARLGEARVASQLPPAQLPRRQATSSTANPAALGPTAPVGIPPATLATLVHAQVQLLHTLLVTIAELEAVIAQRVACHPRAKLLASLPGVGTINLAQLLAEVGPILDRVPSTQQAAAAAAPRRSPRPPARPVGSTSAGPPTVEPARP